MRSWFRRACLAISLGAAVLAGYELLRDSDRPPRSVTVDPMAVEPFDRPVGSYDLVFRLENGSPRSIWVVGLEAG